MHLAELNIARPRYDLDDPRIADFVDNLDRINGLAERSPGFVWRLVGEGDNATDITLPNEPDAIVNLSVWESADHLERFVWNTVHKKFYQRRAEWFPVMEKPHFVMWHVEEGHHPDVSEAAVRLAHLREHGSSEFAFGWDGLPHLKQWLNERCA
ncbi:MAG: DUF3291 domain-containing protein [Rhizobiaceae bacterium]|jgi:heme-degrading monooxygenase HmoA|nr:DUF3291 domain-containing protein [Rhizobiaceae bacterium]